jgi:hypothetical protein
MKAQRDLVGREGVEFDPSPRVVEQPAQLDGNLPMIDADIARAGAEAAGPAPHLAEHVAMKRPNEALGQKIAPAPQRPLLAAQDVTLLGRVQLARVAM